MATEEPSHSQENISKEEISSPGVIQSNELQNPVKSSDDMLMSDRLKKAFDISVESSKQLITISVAIITFTITFSKDFFSSGNKFIALIGWAFYFFSVFSGVATLNALAGQLEPGNDFPPRPTIWAKPVRLFWGLQWVLFILGLLCTLIFGVNAAVSSTIKPLTQDSISHSKLIIQPDTLNIKLLVDLDTGKLSGLPRTSVKVQEKVFIRSEGQISFKAGEVRFDANEVSNGSYEGLLTDGNSSVRYLIPQSKITDLKEYVQSVGQNKSTVNTFKTKMKQFEIN